jgi:hypothetical protein
MFARLIAKGLSVQRKERRVAVHFNFKLPPARFARSHMIANEQEFRDAEPSLREVLNLFLSQVFHLVFTWVLHPGIRWGFTFISCPKSLRITFGH